MISRVLVAVLLLLGLVVWWRDQETAGTYRQNRIEQLQQQRSALAADVLRSRADCMEHGTDGVEAQLRLQCMEQLAKSAGALAGRLEAEENRLRALISAPPQATD